MPTTDPIIIPIEGDPSDFVKDSAKVNSELDKMARGTKTAAGANTGMAQATKAASLSITDLRSAYMIAADAARIAGQVWNATGQEFVNYAEQVKNMSRSLGASAEETSRIIQVADDVRISYESLTVAMKTAQKDGVQPNIEGLAKLADQYVAIQSPTERTKFLLDTFGKSGLEMGKLMEKGGDGIRKMSSDINDNMIMTEKGIKASDDYQRKIDDLNDSVTALSMSIGEKLVPVMTDAATMANANVTAFTTFGDVLSGKVKLNDWAASIINANNVYEDTGDIVEDNTDILIDNSDAVTDNKEAIEASKDALKDYQDALKAVSEENLDNESTSRKIADDRKQYEEDHKKALEEQAEAQRELAAAEAEWREAGEANQRLREDVTFAQHDLNDAIAKYGENSDEAAKARRKLDDAMAATSEGDVKIAEAQAAYDETTKSLQALEIESMKARDSMIYDMIATKLAVDGLTDSELKALDAYAVSKGIKSQADVDETNRRIEEANAVVEGIKASEDVMVEDKKIAEETKRLETAISAEEALAANAAQAESVGVVTASIDSATLSYQRMAEAALATAAAAATIPPVSGTSSSGSENVMHSRDSGGSGVAGTPYMIGTGAQPEVFIPKTNGTFIPNADKLGSKTVNITISNPKGEASENSIRRALKQVSYLGYAI